MWCIVDAAQEVVMKMIDEGRSLRPLENVPTCITIVILSLSNRITAPVVTWVSMGLFTHSQREREVAGSRPGRGTIVGGVFRPAIGMVFSPEYAIYSKF